MRPRTSRFSCITTSFAILAWLNVYSVAAAADAANCRAISNDAERLVCYDDLGSTPAISSEPARQVEVPPAPVAAPAVTPVPDTDAATEALDDDVGLEKVKGREEKQQVLVKGHVSSCREDGIGKFRFYFDNGQIWQQKDNRKIPWRTCDWDVTIKKDFFGYKMSPVGENRSIRIARIK